MKIAVIQAGTVWLNTARTLEKLEGFASQAAGDGCKLVLFPEAFLGGYPKGIDFGTVVGMRSDAGRDLYAAYTAAAIVRGDATDQHIADIATKLDIHIVTGFIERKGSTLYCSIGRWEPVKGFSWARRKIMPTAQERVIWGMGDNEGFAGFTVDDWRAHGAICWENYMPLLRQAMYETGVQIYCAPTVDDRDAWQSSLRHIAREGRCFVLASSQYFSSSNYPAEWKAALPFSDEILIRGGSAILGPMGDYIAGPLWDQEGMLTTELDKIEITRGNLDFDSAGHYSRPDLLKLKLESK